MNDIRSALAWASTVFNKIYVDARLDAEILLSYTLSKNRTYLFSYPEQSITQEQLSEYQKLVQQRAQGMPIAYLTGQREFWSLSLKVNQSTLIPRHETECLVELALELLPQDLPLHVLDLGTGSGAIALALAHERSQWHITACDKSIDALRVAQENAQHLNLTNLSFYHSDWFAALPAQQYHAILSNPPYIAAEDPHLMEGDVRFEPLSALVSGPDGLHDLQYISTQGYHFLRPNGLLLLEHGYQQKDSLKAILNTLGYYNLKCWQDMAGHDRISGGWKPSEDKA